MVSCMVVDIVWHVGHVRVCAAMCACECVKGASKCMVAFMVRQCGYVNVLGVWMCGDVCLNAW